ncbi:MAG: cytochrome c [Chloroflexi bacterium]|nr:cytochrome c [Chloroflexota bacterium]
MCGKCHGQRGQGLLAPRLIGDDSLAGHATAQDLFNFVSTYMPADSPGSLKGDDYWAVVGFLLKQNNLLPQNGKALGSDSAPEISLKR